MTRNFLLRLAMLAPRWERRLIAGANRAVGFSGRGPTLLDHGPELNRFELWLTADVRRELSEIHRAAWRQAVIEVTGEDPEVDWC